MSQYSIQNTKDSKLKTEEMVLNMGPQHPSTHGVLRLELQLDGEIITNVIPHQDEGGINVYPFTFN